MSFDRLVTPASTGEGRLGIDVPDGWQQGRGAYGGLVLATLARAAGTAVTDPARALRSMTAEIVGPVQPGAADLAVEVLRAGTGVTTVAARLSQGGELLAHAVVAYGKARDTYATAPTLEPPHPAPWRSIAPVPDMHTLGPRFARHVEYRVHGAPPFSGAAVADTMGWVRFVEPGEARDAALLIGMIDAWWPAMLITAARPRAMATLAFTFQRVGDLAGLDPEAPLCHRGRVLAGGDGYLVEARELWGEDGRLLALNQQTMVVMQ